MVQAVASSNGHTVDSGAAPSAAAGASRSAPRDTSLSAAGGAALPAEAEALTASQEDYLKAILQAERSSRVARVSEIALHLGVSQPSVTGALKNLRGRGLVCHAPYGHVTLTEEGKEIALEVERRHEAIRCFLIDVLSIDEDRAEATACRLEHVLEPDILAYFVSYTENKTAPYEGTSSGRMAGGPGRKGGNR